MFKIVLIILSLLLAACQNDSSKETYSTTEKPVAIHQMATQDFSPYDLADQERRQAEIDDLKANAGGLDQPLLIQNPYGTLVNSLYVYFESDQISQVEYTVQVDGIENFTNSPVNFEDFGRYEFVVLGLVPGENNHLHIVGKNSQGDIVEEYEDQIDMPDLKSDDHKNHMDRIESDPLAEGPFYISMGNSEDNAKYSYAFDNQGVVRWELETDGERLEDIVRLSNDELLFGVGKHKLARMDGLGRVTQVYEFPDYAKHHDFIVTPQDDKVLILTTDVGADTLEDTIISVDLQNGQVEKIIDMKDLLPDYYQETRQVFLERANQEQENYNLDEDYDGNFVSDEGRVKDLDWIHLNSLELINDDQLIVSARENSAIIKIDDIYDQPRLSYIIGEEDVWQGTAASEFLLQPLGDFPWQAGQHTVKLHDPAIQGSQYELTLFNNNYWRYTSRPDYTGSIPETAHLELDYNSDYRSYYYRYLVDEEARTVSLVKSFEVPYSSIVSSVDQDGNDILVNSGKANLLSQYDADGQLLSQYQYQVTDWSYRIKKLDLNGIFFEIE